MDKPRTPCRCGAAKPSGRGRSYCDNCQAEAIRQHYKRTVEIHRRQQQRLRAGAPDNGASRCRRCRMWRPEDHFRRDGHERTSDWLRRSTIDRWRAKVTPLPGGCWQWTGSKVPNGYGGFWDGKRRMPAHRVGYELLVGPIPPGLQIDHLCRNPSCVNPDHLEPVTPAENVRRGIAGEVAQNRQYPPACPSGHLFDTENTGRKKAGWRRCRACDRAYYHRKKAQRVKDSIPSGET